MAVHLDPLDYAASADLFRAVANNAMSHYATASSQLRRYGAMAGDDNGGQAFADAYDGSAQVMLQSLHDIAVTCSAFDRGLMATGRLHHQAEQYAAGLPANDGAFVIRPLLPQTCVAGPPSAYGGPAEPGIIDVVRDIFALIWPNADVPLMRQAAATWTGIADDFTALARSVRLGTSPLSGTMSAEVDAILRKTEELAAGIDELAVNAGEIAGVCQGYADDVDDAHNEILPMVGQLIAEIAIGAGLSVALSFVTFGAAGAVGAAAMAIRVASIAVRVGGILSRVLGTALRVAERLRVIAMALTNVARRFEKLFEIGIEIAASTGSALIMESQEENPNWWAAAAGGFVGGGVGGTITTVFASRPAALATRIGVGTIAGSASGASGVVVDNLIRYGEVDARELALGTLLGGGLGGPLSALPKPGGGPHGGSTPDGGGAPKIETPNLPQGPDLDVDLPGLDAPDGPGAGGGAPLGSNPSTVIAPPDPTHVDLGGSGIPNRPSEIPSNPSEIPNTPSEIPNNPSEIPNNPSEIPNNPSEIPNNPSDIPNNPSEIPNNPSEIPNNPSEIPNDPSGIPGSPDGDGPASGDLPGSPDGPGGPAPHIDVDSRGARLLDEPEVYGAPSPRPDPEPTPADVLARPDVQQLLTGDPPRLVLDGGVLRLADTQEVTFTASNPGHPLPEFLRQGALQERAGNDLTVGQLQANQQTYDLNGRTGQSEQAAYRRDVDMSDSPYDANDVLHSLDQNAGGDPLSFDGVGHSGINRSIGSQWRREIALLNEQLDEALAGIADDLRTFIHPRIEIRIFDAVSGRIPS